MLEDGPGWVTEAGWIARKLWPFMCISLWCEQHGEVLVLCLCSAAGLGRHTGLSQPQSSVFPPHRRNSKHEEPSAASQEEKQREGTKLAPRGAWCTPKSPAFPLWAAQPQCLTQFAKLIRAWCGEPSWPCTQPGALAARISTG